MIPNPNPEPCRLCGASKPLPRFRAKGFTLCQCEVCGYLQIDRPPAAEELTAIYDGSYFNKGKYVDDQAERREQNRRLDLLRRADLPRGGRLLDYGCATGVFLSHARHHFETWGAEISEDALGQARESLPDLAQRLIALDGLSGLPAGHFDAIAMWDVAEHLAAPQTTFQEVARLLKPNGILVLSTPDVSAATARLMGPRWAFMTPPEHVGFFSKSAMSVLLAKSGFEPLLFRSKGKWVNVGFVAYKLNRVLPELMPHKLADWVRGSWLGRRCVYVPTGDILYAAARKI